MKPIILKALIYWKVLVNFSDVFSQSFTEPLRRIFGPDDNSYPAIGVQPYSGDYYSEWE